MFRSFQRLLTEFERDDAAVRQGLTRALEWRGQYEDEAAYRDEDDRPRRSVSTALDRAFTVAMHDSVRHWAPPGEDYFPQALEEWLTWLDTRLKLELASLDEEFQTALTLNLRFDPNVILYQGPQGWFTYRRGLHKGFVPWTKALFQERFLAEDYAYEEVAVAGPTVNRTARAFDPNAQTPGFVTNVIALCHGQQQQQYDIRDHTPDVIAAMYAGTFANPQDARDRLKIVVGLNALEAPDRPSARQALTQEVARAGNIMNGLPGNAVVIGVLWSPEWFDSMRNDFVTVDQVRQALGLISDDPTDAVPRAYFPYAGLRDYLKDHRFTTQFTNELQTAGLRPFMHIGDGDPVSLATPPQAMDLGLNLVPLHSVGLLDRFDEVWGGLQANQKAQIARVSGGFALRATTQGGDLNPMEATTTATVRANELDMAVRAVLGDIAYFPEPNTFVDMALAATFDLAQDQLTFPEPDLGPLLGRLVWQAGYWSLYDPRLSLITSGRNAKVTVTQPGMKQLAEWVTQKNHSASFTAWTFRVEEYYGLQAGTAVAILKQYLDQGERMMLGMVWGTNWSQVKKLNVQLNQEVLAAIVNKAKDTVKVFRAAAVLVNK